MRTTIILVISLMASGCSQRDSNQEKKDGNHTEQVQSGVLDVNASLSEHWPQIQGGAVDTMFIEGKSYDPFQKYADMGFGKDQTFRVNLTRFRPPEAYSNVKIVPTIRVWIPSVPVMYEKRFSAETLGGSNVIELAVSLDELPPLLVKALSVDNLRYAVGYKYEGRWCSCMQGNFIYPPAAEES